MAQNQQHMSRAKYFTVNEVADVIRISGMTVYRLIKSGELPAIRVGKSVRVREEDLDAYLARQYTQAG
jgi:excisionase family DNA binding protein